MDDISNIINLELNENRPILDNHKVNDIDILNGSAENKLSATESVAFLNSPLSEKQALTNVNNNLQNEKPNNSFTVAEEFISNNSEENVFLTSEAGTTKAANINSSSLANEAPTCIETSNNISCKSLQNNSGFENEVKNDSDTKSKILNSNEIPVGNVSFPSEALSDEVFSDTRKNQGIDAAQSNEISVTKTENIEPTHTEGILDGKNNSYVVVPDLVDFSFRDQENFTGDLLGSFTTIDSLSKKSEPSPNSTFEEIPGNNPAGNVQENKPLNTSTELLKNDLSDKVTKSPISILEKSGVIATTDNCDVLGQSININSPLKIPENPVNEVNYVVTSENISVELEKPSKAAEEVFAVDSSSTNNESKEIIIAEAAFQEPKNTSKNELDEVSPLKVERVSFGMSGSTNNESNEITIAEAVFQEPENTFKNELDEVSPLKLERVSFGMSDKSMEECANSEFGSKVPLDNPSEQFSDPISASDNPVEQFSDSPFKVPEVPSNNPLEQLSDPASAFKMPEIPSGSPLEQFSDSAFKMSEVPSSDSLKQFPDSAFKVPEVPSNHPLEQFPDSAFKVPEIPTNNSLKQFSDHALKVPEVPSNNVLEQCSSPDFDFKMPEKPVTNEGDEQFVDAVQFFKDPNSFQFLENIRTSTVQPGSNVPRSSLYVNFDPLHSKFQTNVPRQDNCALITAAVQENIASVENPEKCSPEVVNKHLVDVAARESLGSILISFDSPKSSTSVDSKIQAQTPTPPKMYTEEEVQQKLKIHELETQDTYLKKQREMETEVAKRDELLRFQRIVIEEFLEISARLSGDSRKGQEKMISLEAENEKLKEDLKTSAEDLQSVENTFTDFYKRYEQCKGMLKTYKDNEEHLKQNISDLQTKAKEQEQMYHMLQDRTEEMLEKANAEMDNVKRSGEAQVTVLKAQLKKAEMKISSLESDIKQIKIENSQLGGICDDLMAKVSQS